MSHTMQGMSDAETAAHLREWVRRDRMAKHGPFGWPTDGCGYDQHMRFVKLRNQHYDELATREDYYALVLRHADQLAPRGETDARDSNGEG